MSLLSRFLAFSSVSHAIVLRRRRYIGRPQSIAHLHAEKKKVITGRSTPVSGSNMSQESLSFAPLFTVKRCSVSEFRTKNPISAQPIDFNLRRRPSRTIFLSINSCLRGGVSDKDGVIIVDHGSRRRESNLMLNEFVAMFRDKTGYPIVEPAHMELAEPSIKDAFNLCIQQGANRVIVSPFFLFPGRHWHKDIPSLTAEAAKEHPGVPYIVTAPLGLHEQLVDVVNDRIKHCLSHVAGDIDECAVCAGTNRCRLYG